MLALSVMLFAAPSMARDPRGRSKKTSSASKPTPPSSVPPVADATCPPASPPMPGEPASGTESNGLVFLRGGCFRMGSNDGERDERPVHPVVLSSFWIGKTEVTEEAYRAFVTATNREPPPCGNSSSYGDMDRAKDPINCVTWQDAVEYCQWKYPTQPIGRLPTEAEWEFAARGEAGRTYPWGEESPDGQVCRDPEEEGTGTCPVDSHPRDTTPEGIRGLAGNVSEWVNDWYVNHYEDGLQRNPSGPSSTKTRVIRGDSYFITKAAWMRGAFRNSDVPRDQNLSVGFRCARGAK